MAVARDRKINSTVHMEAQNISNSKAILSKKSNTGGDIIPDFKVYCKALAIKRVRISTKTVTKNNGTEDTLYLLDALFSLVKPLKLNQNKLKSCLCQVLCHRNKYLQNTMPHLSP
jgi:hypothetical protein